MTTNIDEIRESLRGVLSELESQLGGTGQVEEVRDQLAAELGPFTFEAYPNLRTAFPYSELEQLALPALPDDEMGRVYVMPADPEVTKAARWKGTTDELTGLSIQMRSADCGAGCRCATDVRFVGGFGR